MHVQLQLSSLRLSGLDAFGVTDGLNLGKLNCKGVLQGRNLQFEPLTVGGGVLELTGKGTIIIGATPRESRIASSMQLRPAESLPEMFRELLTLSGKKPDPQGWYNFRVNGRLDAPTFR